MKISLLSLFCTFAAIISVGTTANAQSASTQTASNASMTITPLSAPVEITGRTGGRESSACGNIDTNTSQTIRVTESFASLSFEVQSEGDYTLLITGPDGFRECVFAHNYDGGVIQAPGLLNRGLYEVHVGDRKGESHPYTMSITQ
ncbi:MAG: hypothetical protein AAFU53_11570 [Cyanobacteria bacterium J06632_3]